MKRFSITSYYNNMFLLPTLYLNYERGWYMYVCLSWLKWGIEYRVFDDWEKNNCELRQKF